LALLGVAGPPDINCVKQAQKGKAANARTSSLNPKEEGQKTGRRVAIEEKKEEPPR